MNIDPNNKTVRRVELGLLLALLVFLPLEEAPKNILWVLYVAMWFVVRAPSREWGGAWDRWDTLLLLWIASGFLSILFAGLPGAHWSAPVDLVRYAVLGDLVRRAGYRPRELVALLAGAVFGVLPAIAYGYWELLVTHKRVFLELHSVGHVNHSAIYLAIVFCTALSLFPVALRSARPKLACFVLMLTAVAIGFSLLITSSRAAIGAAVFVAPLLLLLQPGIARRSRIRLIAVLVAVGCVAAVAYVIVDRTSAGKVTGGGIAAKFEVDEKIGEPLSFRNRLWETAAAAAREYPLFGIGEGNFRSADLERVCAWSALHDPGQPCPKQKYYFSTHAHSVYFTVLAEQGLFGLVALLALLTYGFASLIAGRRDAALDSRSAALWGGAFSALTIASVSGVLNTSVHHENGILLLVLLGAWLALHRHGEKTAIPSIAPSAASTPARNHASSPHDPA